MLEWLRRAISYLARRSISRKAIKDSVRLALQAVVASSVTYSIVHVLGMADKSWAIISALFVVHTSVGSTIISSVSRASGTVLGCAVALISIYLLPGSESAIVRLVVISTISAPLVYWRPHLSYALVAAPVLAIAPATQTWESAVAIAGAIFIGSAVGVLSARFVWPQSSRSRAIAALEAALEGCARWWNELVKCLGGREYEARHTLYAQITHQFRTARERISECRRHDAELLEKIANQIERVWHSILIVERVATNERRYLSNDDFKWIAEGNLNLISLEHAAFDEIAGKLKDRRRSLDLTKISMEVERVRNAVDQNLDQTMVTDDPDRERAIDACAFGIYELADSIHELARKVDDL